MKTPIKFIGTIFSLLLITSVLYGQNTATLTGTLSDSDSQVWAYASWSAVMNIPGGGQAYYISGGLSPSTAHGNLTVLGTFQNETLARTDKIIPFGTTWSFTLCSMTSAPCQTINNVMLTSATVNIGTILSSLVNAPRITGVQNPIAYNTAELQSPTTASTYFNSIDNYQYIYYNPGWIKINPSAAPIGAAGGDLTGTYPNPLVNTDTVPKLANNNIWTGTNEFNGNLFLDTGKMLTIKGGATVEYQNTSTITFDTGSILSIFGNLHNGTGFQIASAAGCTIASGAIGNSCTVTLTLPVVEPDTSYIVVGCSLNTAGSVNRVSVSENGALATTSFLVLETALTASGNSGGTISCLVIHQ